MSDDTIKRRRFRFSLRTLLLVMTVSTVAFGGWVHYMREQARENREKARENHQRFAAIEKQVADIGELGGFVESREYGEWRSQTWLEELFDDPGDENFDVLKVTGVVLNDTQVTDTNGTVVIGWARGLAVDASGAF